MGFLSDIGSIIGDTGRQIWTESREKNTITGDAKERLETFIKQAENGDVQANAISWVLVPRGDNFAL